MLTICSRCRTPHDRRTAASDTPRALASWCPSCATGAEREDAALLATVAQLDPSLHDAELTVLPRSVLPAAS